MSRSPSLLQGIYLPVAYLMQRRSEMAYEAIYDDIEAEMPNMAEEAIRCAEIVYDTDTRGAFKRDSPEALEEVAAQAERDRKNGRRRAVRETCETAPCCGRPRSPRRRAGAKSTSLEVYHYLSLRATALQVGRLDDALRRCVSLRDRLENGPLADGVKAAVADAGVELNQGQVFTRWPPRRRRCDRGRAHGRIPMGTAPAPESALLSRRPRLEWRGRPSASELGGTTVTTPTRASFSAPVEDGHGRVRPRVGAAGRRLAVLRRVGAHLPGSTRQERKPRLRPEERRDLGSQVDATPERRRVARARHADRSSRE